MDILLFILQAILGLMFLVTGTIISSGKMADQFTRFGYPSYFNYLTGVTELLGAIGMVVGIWIPIVGILAGMLLGVTMLIAAFTLIVVARDPFKKAIPSIVLALLSFLVTFLHCINALYM